MVAAMRRLRMAPAPVAKGVGVKYGVGQSHRRRAWRVS
jgi:hypothetical protein